LAYEQARTIYVIKKNEGDTLMGFEKYKEKTFHEVYYSGAQSYYDFVKRVPDPDANMKRFMKWVEREKGEIPSDESHPIKKTRVLRQLRLSS
jgi:hypothetical protein